MESSSQTSFIPKKPIATGPVSYGGGGISVVTVVCVIVFFGSVALSVGAYLYKNILSHQLENKKEDLNKAKKGYELDTIEDLKRLDTRIETVKGLLQNHVSMTTFFGLIEESTLRSVRFSDLSIGNSGSSVSSTDSGKVGTLQFKMSGVAKSYSSVALQAKVFTDSKKFKEPVVSNLNLGDSGNVSFSVVASVDSSSLLYKDTLGIPSSVSQQDGQTNNATTTNN